MYTYLYKEVTDEEGASFSLEAELVTHTCRVSCLVFRTENGSSQGQNLALTVLHVPSSLGSGLLIKETVLFAAWSRGSRLPSRASRSWPSWSRTPAIIRTYSGPDGLWFMILNTEVTVKSLLNKEVTDGLKK